VTRFTNTAWGTGRASEPRDDLEPGADSGQVLLGVVEGGLGAEGANLLGLSVRMVMT